jgi:Zn-dependent membrane protease YugP
MPLRVRSGLVPVVNLGSWLGYILFVMGFIVQFSGLTWLGILFFSAAVLFGVVTLPVEYNASGRALQMLEANGIVGTVELEGTRKVLSAAALTYIAALLQAVGQLIYWVLLALGVGKKDE